jgi:N-acetylneuraminate synthase
MSEPVFIIAEAGVNHDGDLATAKKLVDVAAMAGADAVKFQSFKANQLVRRGAPKAAYQTRTTDAGESQLDMLQRLELSEAQHAALIDHARTQGIEFLSSPFDVSSLDLLTKRFGLTTIKIPSGEITNAPFLLAVARAARRVILSTGMSTLEEIAAALGVLAFGFTARDKIPAGDAAFSRALASSDGARSLRERVTLLHCTSEYPAPFEDVNLLAMDTMAARFGLAVGYSDHTPGIHVSLAAVARGARVIEKHFTLDRAMPGPDHAASIEPRALADLVRQIRHIEAALGDGVKRPTDLECKNRDVARKSLVATRSIRVGEVFTAENVATKRPGTGISPFAFWRILGQPARRDYEADDPIDD